MRWTWFLQSYFFWRCFIEICYSSISCSWLCSLGTIYSNASVASLESRQGRQVYFKDQSQGRIQDLWLGGRE